MMGGHYHTENGWVDEDDLSIVEDEQSEEDTVQQLIVSQGRFFIREVKRSDEFCAAPIKSHTMRLATREEIRKHLAPLLEKEEEK